MAKCDFASILLAVVAAATSVDALAQDVPITFAARCPVAEMRVTAGPHGFCDPEFGVFGLSGPTVVGARRAHDDIVATGSITVGDKAREGRHGGGGRK